MTSRHAKTTKAVRPARAGSLAAALLLLAACAGSDDGRDDASLDATPADSQTSDDISDATDVTTTTASMTTTTFATPVTATSVTATPVTTTPVTATPVTATTSVAPAEPVRLNHIQVIGSHNSYHLVPQPALFDGIVAVSAELGRDIEYSHRTLTEQLDDFGIRQFELDVFADPDGGLYADRAANAVVGLPVESGEPALDEPGFKVMHTQDFDYETTCLTLVDCLGEISAWSDAHSSHVPIVVLVELKSLSVPEAAAEEGLELDIGLPWAVPVETTADVLRQLDDEVRAIVGPDQLLEPDDVRGDADTLVEAVEGVGWPDLDSVRGRIIVALNDEGAQRDLYIADSPVLAGRPMFTSSTPGAPDAAFLRFDDPTDPELAAAAADGYLIRTRTDSPTVDARENDVDRLEAALASGAHLLSTDYYEPSMFFDSPYVVALPDGAVARCNPVTAPVTCTPDRPAEELEPGGT